MSHEALSRSVLLVNRKIILIARFTWYGIMANEVIGESCNGKVLQELCQKKLTVTGKQLERSHYYYGPQGIRIQVAYFSPGEGVDECHISIIPSRTGSSLVQQLGEVEEAYKYALEKIGFSEDTTIFRRLFLSSFEEESALQNSSLVCSPKDSPFAVSIIGQPPLPDHRVALWAYHINDRVSLNKESVTGGVGLHREGLVHLWTTNNVCDASSARGSYDQTRAIFHEFIEQLHKRDLSLRDNVIRTWIYVDDIDNNYGGMVKARREIFKDEGLAQQTNYITSTGIEGFLPYSSHLVGVDTYAIDGIDRRQICFLEAPHLLGSTSVYGVTFERGVRVGYRDRAHVLISGTASIDPPGETLHVGDIGGQLKRTSKNIDGLLEAAGASREDLVQMIIYLRNPSDLAAVEEHAEKHYSQIPYVIVQGRVCRPLWLVEIECIALVVQEDESLPVF